MRLLSLAKPLVATLTIAIAASTMGCGLPSEADPESVGTQQQAIAPAAVIGGVGAAIQIVNMLINFRDSGSPITSPAAVLDELTRLDGDIQALGAEVGSALLQMNEDIVNLPIMTVGDNVVYLMRGYRNLANDPAGQETFLADLAAGKNSLGKLTWADLDTMHRDMVGASGESSLIALVAQREQEKGLAGIGDDGLGKFFAEKRLIQEQAFLLLSEASRNDRSIDLTEKTTEQASRRVLQTAAFSSATRTYNTNVVKPTRDARTASVGTCDYQGLTVFVHLTPNDGPYRLEDTACATQPSWISSATKCGGAYDPARFNLDDCNRVRDAYMSNVGDQAAAPWNEKAFRAQTLYGTLSLLGQYASDAGERVTVSLQKDQPARLLWSSSTNGNAELLVYSARGWPATMGLTLPTTPGSRVPNVQVTLGDGVRETEIRLPSGAVFRRTAAGN